MAETQTQSHQQATWQPPLYDPPPSTSRDPGTTPSSSPYPPLPALGNGRGVATDDNKAPSFVTNASTIDEERGLLSGHAVSGHQEDPESRAGKPDLAMRGSGNWLQTWRENKRLILIRFACIMVVLFAIVALILGTISNRSETLPNPVSPGLLVHPLVPR